MDKALRETGIMTDQTSDNSCSSEATPVIEGFRILKKLGHGATSSVWQAEQVSLNRLVVIKVLSERLAHKPEDVVLFKAEARTAANFKHPGIVQVYDFDQSIASRCYYFVMEYIAGYSVGDWIRGKGKIAESDALIVAHMVADAMQYAWNLSKIAHCDIKPGNIMVDGDGSIKVADMGLAHTVKTIASQPGTDTLKAFITGTPNYMAPEQVRGTEAIDCRADIYALGATLFHMVTGQLPFGDSPPDIVLERQLHETFKSPQLVNPDLSIGITQLIVKMTAKAPSARFQTWDEVLAEVRRLDRQMRQQVAASIQPVAAVAEATTSAERPPSADSKNDGALAEDGRVCPYCGKPLQPQALYCEFCGKSVASPAKKTGTDQKHVVVRSKPTLVSSPAGAPPSVTRPTPRLRGASQHRRPSWGGYFRILLSLCFLAFLGYYAYQKIKYDHDVIIPIKAAIIQSVQPVLEKGLLFAEQGLKGITQWSYKLLWSRFLTRPAPPAELPEEAAPVKAPEKLLIVEEEEEEEEAPEELVTVEAKPEEAPPVTKPEIAEAAAKPKVPEQPWLSASAKADIKSCSRLVTAEMRANALGNVKQHAWAREEQQRAVAAAAPWVALSDDALWDLIPSQKLPRDGHTNKEIGCPNCGKDIVPYGNYPWVIDFWDKPWKLRCPSCAEDYPKNDFLAFYRTALDKQGFFRKELGNRALLFNAEHPNPRDPLHKLYVDDGLGMVDKNGNRHNMIAYYTHWGQWDNIIIDSHGHGALVELARAYTLTDDPLYAHKAAVLLDRIADVYPEMDYVAVHDMKGFYVDPAAPGITLRQPGRIHYLIGETFTATALADAYDRIFDGIQGDEKLARFCADKAQKHRLGDKRNIAAICRHIEKNILREIWIGIGDGRISGNMGMHQESLVAAAIALDRPKESAQWLDDLFEPDFPMRVGKSNSQKKAKRLSQSIPGVLVGRMTRDGIGAECGGYGLLWTQCFRRIAEMMTAYPAYTNHNMLKEFPTLKQGFMVEARLNCLDAAMPPIGDSGSTGGWGRAGDVTTFVRGFRLYRDPRMAALAWHFAEQNNALGWHFTEQNAARLRLPSDIYEKNPDRLVQQIIAAAEEAGPFKLRCDHLGQYGQAVLQTDERSNGRAVWIHYGYGLGHSHSDSLNIGLYAKNIDMLPDLGYPEYMSGHWPNQLGWTAITASHNTLICNDKKADKPGGKITLFGVQPPLRVIDVSAPNPYPDVDTYRRTVALVDVSDEDSYVFDVFRARGGNNHRLSYHGPSATATVTGLELKKQLKGTFAGEKVAFAQFYDGQAMGGYQGSGFMYLYDVERSTKPFSGYFTVDWGATDRRGRIESGHEPHLRLHALNECDEVALASGDPPQNKYGNPRRLRYLIQSRLGKNVKSQFVTVLEPYDRTPFIKQVRLLKVKHQARPDSVAAVAVELENGATDVLISCAEPTRVNVEGGIEFEGQMGMVRIVRGEVKCMRMSNAVLLKFKNVELVSKLGAYKGMVTKVDVSDPMNNLIFLNPPLPQDDKLVGQVIHFKSAVPYDTSWDIATVGNGFISIGDITVIAGFKSSKNYRMGYKLQVNAGDKYVVPIHAGLDR
ncbi:MAG: protein kinase [Verrucomicrobiota bacterium]